MDGKAAVVATAVMAALTVSGGAAAGQRGATFVPLFPTGIRALDGGANNVQHPSWGEANTPYLRVTQAFYADGKSAMVAGPSPRYVSNRIFNDVSQNLFSENNVSRWGWVWGQFLDHTFGLRQEGTQSVPIAFSATDALEQFRNDFGAISFARSAAAPGSGVASPRQQVNTVSSYIDAWNVYGGSGTRLDWLRAGSLDGNPTNNSARLLTVDGYLPLAGARGDVSKAPDMQLMGRLMGAPQAAVVAGDVRANENIALTGVHTLFVREHNRIVGLLPRNLPEETKFQIARRIVGAELQWITYTEFLPSLGVRLSPYRGYNPGRDASLSNEFATVGYRGHSMVHGDIDAPAADGRYTADQLDAFEQQGIDVENENGQVNIDVPLNVAFGNPGLVPEIGLGPLLEGLALKRQYRNDEQIDNQLRSVLFQVPGPDVSDPSACLDGRDLPNCFKGVVDLGALDIARQRDHGIPLYNRLRQAYGLPAKRSLTAITGEATQSFPNDPNINPTSPINDPNILDFVRLLDRNGNQIQLGSVDADQEAVRGFRRSTVAARLKAIYGDVDKVDAFVGMVAERHVPGTEFGELQLAMWKRQFEALRDGDRFFYFNDPSLPLIRYAYGIDYRRSLAQLIVLNTDVGAGDIQRNAFRVP